MPIVIRVAAARAMAAVRFNMTAGPVLVTVAVRTSAPIACAPAHIGCTGLSWSENALFTIGETSSRPVSHRPPCDHTPRHDHEPPRRGRGRDRDVAGNGSDGSQPATERQPDSERHDELPGPGWMGGVRVRGGIVGEHGAATP